MKTVCEKLWEDYFRRKREKRVKCYKYLQTLDDEGGVIYSDRNIKIEEGEDTGIIGCEEYILSTDGTRQGKYKLTISVVSTEMDLQIDVSPIPDKTWGLMGYEGEFGECD